MPRRTPVRNDNGVRLYAPTGAKTTWRVVAGSGRAAVERTATSRADADALFDQMALWARENVETGGRKGSGQDRSVNALAARTVAWLRSLDRSPRYIDKVDDTLRVHVLPVIGGLNVTAWTPQHSAEVIASARAKGLAPATVQDIGAAMRSMVATAHRKPRWLPTSDDPLEGVPYAVKATVQGQTARFVPLSMRPTTSQVLTVGAWLGLSRQASRYPWLPLAAYVMGFSGLRLGELLALRSCDVPDGGVNDRRIHVTGTVEKRNKAGSTAVRKPPKNGKTRETVYPSWLHSQLRRHVETVAAVSGSEAPLFPRADGSFLDTSAFNKLVVQPAMKTGAWPGELDWENLRHHAATWWHGRGVPIETVSFMLGHASVAFTFDRYFRVADDSLTRAMLLVG